VSEGAHFPVTRRTVLTAALGATAAGVAGCTPSRHTIAKQTAAAGDVEPFYGAHQAGIVTPAQAYQLFSAFDLASARAADLRRLLVRWTSGAEALTRGAAVSALADRPDFTDSGEAVGASPARLTITIGYGPSLFDARFGLAARKPAALAELPRFATDNLQPALCGGDLALQVCADDAQVAFHAHRQLVRLARELVTLRWSQSGFRGPQLGDAAKPLTRNLFGFHDGVQNPTLNDEAALNSVIWASASDGAEWMAGGTYLVTRRILLFTDGWDDVPDAEQERIIGRAKSSGAPLSGGSIASPLNLAGTRADGGPAIPLDAHVRLAAAATNHGAQILRRSYAYFEPVTGGLQPGQLFCSLQRDPRTGFVPIQARLSQFDALNTHTQHIGSAVFAIPPGIQAGQTWAATLFGA
jgi:deferrochelatase/peroxidase EfeB